MLRYRFSVYLERLESVLFETVFEPEIVRIKNKTTGAYGKRL